MRNGAMDDEAKWSAMLARDASADGRFYYGVRSTGVVCRPSCPSRRPGRKQVVFFADVEQAQAAGFRACRRCHPEQPGEDAHDYQAVRRACDLLHAQPDRSIAAVARAVGLPERRMQRAFEWWTGVSPREYRGACRLSGFKARAAAASDTTIAALDAGYPSTAGLYEQAGALGMSPGAYRAGGAGLVVRWTAWEHEAGAVLLAATDAGICALHPGESVPAVVATFEREFARAERRHVPEALAPWRALVDEYLAGRARALPLPLDVSGTLFQVRVWSALRTIPPGESRTYGEIAALIGQPGAARAVGRACGANPVALAIPCHRVAGASGNGGYRWGAARKHLLREQERAAMASGPVGAGAVQQER